MNQRIITQPLALASVFLWIGFVGAISFMEAWLKFRAPGVTLPIGLGIGRLVFAALNKVEWVFALIIAISAFRNRRQAIPMQTGLLLGAIAILIIQTAWLLPGLDARAELHISGASVPHSNLHIYYVAAEGLKMVCLVLLGAGHFGKVPAS
jgi:uncharacterized membrane protein (DUF485 family)